MHLTTRLLSYLWMTLSGVALCVQAAVAEVTIDHAIAMHGSPKYEQGFKQFDYTSLEARKGGRVNLHEIGTFDSLNSFITKGSAASAVGMIYDTLTVSSADEAFTQYGLVAEKIEYPEDRSWVIFHLNPNARFHDGHPITADDVAYTFELLTTKGNPFYGFYYADVEQVSVLSERKIKFSFKPNSSRETLLIIGQLPVLPKHFWQQRQFDESSLEVPLGSGPYQITAVDLGRSLTLSRKEDYWAKDHPVRKGMFNFDQIRYDYYRDDVVALEAFKAGEYDYRAERTSKLWSAGYEGTALQSGKIKKTEIAHQNPTGMQAFIFNLRRPVFQDVALRQAMTLAFDFEWANKNLFYNAYTRTESYFSNSDMASSGLPSDAELALLEPHREQLPSAVFDKPFKLPSTDGKGNNRQNLRTAKRLLDQSGYRVENNQLISPVTGAPVAFEILLYSPAFERVVNPFVKSLSKLGISATVRLVDTSQYINRRRSFDFDMMVNSFGQSLSPGNEQRDYWHSSAATTPGSRNLIGIQSPAVDGLVEQVINAHTREELVTACRALDRTLLHSYYVIPQWHINKHRIAYWDKFEQPPVNPKYDATYDTGFMTWWITPEQDAR